MILQPTDENIEHCAKVLRDGGIVGMPTETVYGLAASITREDALERIFSVKGRPADNPLIVHVASVDDACALTVPEYHVALRRVAAAFWPGPVTCVLPAASTVSPRVTAGLATVAVRMPQHPVALALIKAAATPLAAPSANRSGRPSPTTAQHVIDDLGEDLDVLDGGPCTVGLESTVLRLSDTTCTILRPGSVTREDLSRELGVAVEVAIRSDDLRSSPGTRYRHYAPSCAVVLCGSEEEIRQRAAASDMPVMVLSERAIDDLPLQVVPGTLSESALYAEFRRADDLQLGAILVLCDSAVQGREALANRLRKAASALEENI